MVAWLAFFINLLWLKVHAQVAKYSCELKLIYKLLLNTEAHSEISWTSKMEPFAKIVNG